MKKIIIYISFLIIAPATFSQQTKSSSVLTKQDYLQKSKLQKKTAVILLLGGTATVLVGSLVVAVITHSLEAGAIVFAAGSIAIPASIPFFIAASRNKKKAMSLSFTNEIIPRQENGIFKTIPVPALAFKISL